MYLEMEELLETAMKAYKAWGEKNDHPLILADLGFHLSVQWLQRGDFKVSEEHMLRSLEIYEDNSSTDPAVLLAPYNHISNVMASALKFEEAIVWQEKVLAVGNSIQDDSMKRIALLNCNLGRALFLAGRIDQGEARLEQAREEFTGSQNWAMLAL